MAFCGKCGAYKENRNDICTNCETISNSPDSEFELTQEDTYSQLNYVHRGTGKSFVNRLKDQKLIILIVAFSIVVICLVISPMTNCASPSNDDATDESNDFPHTQAEVDSPDDIDDFSDSSFDEIVLPHEEASNEYYKSFHSTGSGAFNQVKASSYADWDGTRGLPNEVADGSRNTAWQDGIPNDYGIGEWILFYNSDESAETISQVTVYNRYQYTGHNTSSKDFYQLNSRVHMFSIEFSDGTIYTFELLEDTKDPQTFYFDIPISTPSVKFIIDSVYNGTKYSDTCISEIVFG